MKVDNPSFDKQELVRLLQRAYAIDVTNLVFVPKGEESYSYIATTSAGRSYFIKVHQATMSPELIACYRFVYHLRNEENCHWAVGPYVTVDGEFLAPLDKCAVAVFDYIEGTNRLLSELSESQQAHFAGHLVKLHSSVSLAVSSGVPKETFSISFKAWLLEVLDAVEEPLKTNHAWSQMAYDLLHAEKPHISGLLETIDRIATRLQATDQGQCVTHGDLASYNIIQGEDDNLFLIDWGKLCIAPAARDLVTLWGEGYGSLLAAYFQPNKVSSASSAFSAEMFTYYMYYNLLAIITDYGSWLILEESTPDEAENAWVALSQVLPLDFRKIQVRVEQLMSHVMNITSST
jgi:thiamine kinase-like enzyme